MMHIISCVVSAWPISLRTVQKYCTYLTTKTSSPTYSSTVQVWKAASHLPVSSSPLPLHTWYSLIWGIRHATLLCLCSHACAASCSASLHHLAGSRASLDPYSLLSPIYSLLQSPRPSCRLACPCYSTEHDLRNPSEEGKARAACPRCPPSLRKFSRAAPASSTTLECSA